MITLVAEAITGLPNRSPDSAITPLKDVFIVILDCSADRINWREC